MITTITKERFEAWLFAQPRERRFNIECENCLIATFLKETVKGSWSVGGSYFRIRGGRGSQPFQLPEWLSDLVFYNADDLSIAAIQDAFVAAYLTTPNELEVQNTTQTDALAVISNAPPHEKGD